MIFQLYPFGKPRETNEKFVMSQRNLLCINELESIKLVDMRYTTKFDFASCESDSSNNAEISDNTSSKEWLKQFWNVTLFQKQTFRI